MLEKHPDIGCHLQPRLLFCALFLRFFCWDIQRCTSTERKHDEESRAADKHELGLFASTSNGNAACLQPGVTVCQRGGALSCNGIQFPRVPGTDETKNCGASPRELNLCVSEYLLVSPGLQVLHIPITKFGKRASIFVFFAIQHDTPLLVVLCSLLIRK